MRQRTPLADQMAAEVDFSGTWTSGARSRERQAVRRTKHFAMVVVISLLAAAGDVYARFTYTPTEHQGEILVSISEDLFQRLMKTGLRGRGYKGAREPGTILLTDGNAATGQPGVRCRIGRSPASGSYDAWVGRHADSQTGQILERTVYMTCERDRVRAQQPQQARPPEANNPAGGGTRPGVQQQQAQGGALAGCCEWKHPSSGVPTCSPESRETCSARQGTLYGPPRTSCVTGQLSGLAKCCADAWGRGC